MKPGIYYSSMLNDLINYIDLHNIEVPKDSILNDVPSENIKSFLTNHYEFICDFWNESAELEKYKKALAQAIMQRDYHIVFTDRTEREKENWKYSDNLEIDHILYGKLA